MANKKTFEVALILTAADKASRIINDMTVNAKKRMDNMSAMGSRAFDVGRNAATAGFIGAGIMALPLKAAADMEKLNISLKTSFQGNDKAAAEAFKRINTFASKTPYEVGEVTTAFIKLKNMGLDPSESALTAYGNTASAMGKDLNEMIEAVADAATGEFERLKEFGIKAKSEGDNVTFTFQGVKTTVGKNSKEIEQYLKYIGNVKFAGGIEAQSKSVYGQLSTLKDGAVMAAAKIGTVMIPKLKELFEKITPIIERITKWIEKNPQLTSTIFKIVAAATALSFAVSVSAFVFGGLFKTISAVMWIGSAYRNTLMLMRAAQMAYTFTLLSTGSGFAAVSAGLKIMNLGFLMSPIFWAIAIIAGAAYLIYKNWDKIKAYFVVLWEVIKVAFSKFWEFIKKWGVLLLGPVGLIIKYWDQIKAFFLNLWPKVKSIFINALNWYLGLPKMFLNIGTNIVMGLWNGIKAKAAALFDFVKGIGKKVADTFKNVLGIASPSKVFMDYGVNITEGAKKGIQKGSPSLAAASGGMANGIKPSANNRGGGSGGGVTVNFAPVINGGGSAQDVLAQLKAYTPQLIREIEAVMERKRRLSY